MSVAFLLKLPHIGNQVFFPGTAVVTKLFIHPKTPPNPKTPAALFVTTRPSAGPSTHNAV